jgi:hypothetical protein
LKRFMQEIISSSWSWGRFQCYPPINICIEEYHKLNEKSRLISTTTNQLQCRQYWLVLQNQAIHLLPISPNIEFIKHSWCTFGFLINLH